MTSPSTCVDRLATSRAPASSATPANIDNGSDPVTGAECDRYDLVVIDDDQYVKWLTNQVRNCWAVPSKAANRASTVVDAALARIAQLDLPATIMPSILREQSLADPDRTSGNRDPCRSSMPG